MATVGRNFSSAPGIRLSMKSHALLDCGVGSGEAMRNDWTHYSTLCYSACMRIFKTKAFVKSAKKERLTDVALKNAIKEIQQGLVDAYLGSNLIKKRIAIGGKGKSGGLRTILVYQDSIKNVFCVYVFSKNERENVTLKQLDQLRLLADFLLSRTAKQLEEALKAGEIQEVNKEDEHKEGNTSKDTDEEKE